MSCVPSAAAIRAPIASAGCSPKRACFQLGRGDHVRALRDRLVKQPSRRRRGHQVHHAEPARRFTRDRYVRRIAAERGDIALHPAQRLDLIEQAIVAGDLPGRLRAQLGMREIAEDPETIIDRYDDHTALGELGAVVHRLAARTGRERAAMNPDHHRCVADALLRPDIEEQAVFAQRAEIPGIDAAGACRGLDARRPELGRIAHPVPHRHLDWRLPPRGANGRLRIRQAFEHLHRVVNARLSLHRPVRGRQDLGQQQAQRTRPQRTRR